jgi:hypothetical protein
MIDLNVSRWVDPAMLWHQRMGHIGEKGLRAMQKKGMVEDFPYCNLRVIFCEHYTYGKKNWVMFPFGVMRVKAILELIHSDLFGHVELIHSDLFGHVTVPSLVGSIYCVSFLDIFSRNKWIYFMRKKSEVSRNSKSLNFSWKTKRIRRSSC